MTKYRQFRKKTLDNFFKLAISARLGRNATQTPVALTTRTRVRLGAVAQAGARWRRRVVSSSRRLPFITGATSVLLLLVIRIADLCGAARLWLRHTGGWGP